MKLEVMLRWDALMGCWNTMKKMIQKKKADLKKLTA